MQKRKIMENRNIEQNERTEYFKQVRRVVSGDWLTDVGPSRKQRKFQGGRWGPWRESDGAMEREAMDYPQARCLRVVQSRHYPQFPHTVERVLFWGDARPPWRPPWRAPWRAPWREPSGVGLTTAQSTGKLAAFTDLQMPPAGVKESGG